MPAAPPDLVVLDTETTGLDPRADRVIDIGAVRLDGRLREMARFDALVDPGVPVPLYITRLTGITDADLAAASGFADVYPALLEFCAGAVLVGHNVGFDRDHLAAEARRAGQSPLDAAWFDTLEAALILYPELDRHALPLLADELAIAQRAHRALPDALTTAEVFRRLCGRAAGLAEEERRLLTSVAWPPLAALDARRMPPDEAPPPLVADEPRGGGGAALTGLPAEEDGWRVELGVDAAGAEAGEPALAGRLGGFRRRPGQVELAGAIAATLAAGGVGLFEAGTGMGKSLAYLLPAAFHSAARGRRLLVSTKTKALQRQLAARELPLVAEALPPGWRWSVLMGRENYICRRRLDEAVAAESEGTPNTDRAMALAYLVGRARRGDVDLSALPFRATLQLPALSGLARELRSSRATCLGRYCPARRGCHWRLARSRAEAAHLVCVNHALLLSGAEMLPPFEDVVIDEAHLLYGEATSAYSEEISAAGLDQLLDDVRGHRRQRPLATRLRALARSAEPVPARTLTQAADVCELAAADVPPLLRAVGAALSGLAAATIDAEGDDSLRTGGPAAARRSASRSAARDYDRSVWITPGLREQPAWEPFAAAVGLLAEQLAGLAQAAALAAEALPEEHRDHAAAAALADDAARAAELLSELPEGGRADAVVWAQVEAGATHAAGTSGHSSPPPSAGRSRARRWTPAGTFVRRSGTSCAAPCSPARPSPSPGRSPTTGA